MVRELSDGTEGDEVRALQTVLFEMGYTEVGTPDGQFGNNTIAAVIRFQSERGLPVTGVVDEVSRATIVATATTYGLAHLSSSLVADANAYAHGVAPHHADAHDLVTAPAAAPAAAAPAGHGAGGHIPEGAQRSEDGNGWWDGAEWQSVHAAAAAATAAAHTGAAHAGTAHGDSAKKHDYIDLLQGVTDLT